MNEVHLSHMVFLVVFLISSTMSVGVADLEIRWERKKATEEFFWLAFGEKTLFVASKFSVIL